jgi:hypothetical protein
MSLWKYKTHTIWINKTEIVLASTAETQKTANCQTDSDPSQRLIGQVWRAFCGRCFAVPRPRCDKFAPFEGLWFVAKQAVIVL